MEMLQKTYFHNGKNRYTTTTTTTTTNAAAAAAAVTYMLIEDIARRICCVVSYKTKYVQRNTEARSCIRRCSGSQNLLCYEWVFVSLGIQHAMRLRHIGVGGQTGSAVIFNIISHKVRFAENIFWT